MLKVAYFRRVYYIAICKYRLRLSTLNALKGKYNVRSSLLLLLVLVFFYMTAVKLAPN